MNVALLGYPCSGKSTLFRAIAGPNHRGVVATLPIPDPRLEFLADCVRAKKRTPATITFADDLDDVRPAGKALTLRFLDAVRQTDVLMHVVRAFESDGAPYHAAIDPVRDEAALESELALADLQVLETRAESLGKSPLSRSPGAPEYAARRFCERAIEALSSGTPLRRLALDETERTQATHLQLLTMKPSVIARNTGAWRASDPESNSQPKRPEPMLILNAALEAEASELEEADRKELLSAAGWDEPLLSRLAKGILEASDVITFFTTVGSETRAWLVRRGSTALDAAGAIHTDLARGFIRAEVVAWGDFAELGSAGAAHHAGRQHVHGKDYVVQDGDVIAIRHKS
jgi:ribosome-binding ATPase YchF (GTP1/OBG family)